MRLNLSRKLQIISLIFFPSLASCGTHAPKNTPCLINAPNQTLQCSDGQTVWSVKLIEADKFVCWSPSDTERLLKYIRILEANQKNP